ncbi:MAG TPA: amphi-Trp domain-containing protein [Halobacteriales archaeon]|nr:amphi-Trp domain-containing protein [Halobacteriales archaeon]
MPEEVLLKTEELVPRMAIPEAFGEAPDQLESGDVQLVSDTEEQNVSVPKSPQFEVELERLTDSETGDQRYELEYETGWTK